MSVPEWIGVGVTTASSYIKGSLDETLRKRIYLAMLKQKGRIKFGADGKDLNWDVQFDEHPFESFADMGAVTFERHNLYQQLSLDWRGYKMSSLVSLKQELMNRGTSAIVNQFATELGKMKEAFDNRIGAEFFIDGNAVGAQNRMHGLESFCGSGTTVATDRIAQPSDTYGGKNTNLGDQGGRWSAAGTAPNAAVATDWPNGSGDVSYDYMTPKLLNYSSTAWNATGTTSWEDNCIKVLRQGILWLTSTGGSTGEVDMFLCNQSMKYDLMNRMESKTRIDIPMAAGAELGITGTLNFEGVGVHSDFDIAANTGYLVNFDKMEMMCMFDQFYDSYGPEWSLKDVAYLFLLIYFGNMRFRPKHFGKVAAYA